MGGSDLVLVQAVVTAPVITPDHGISVHGRRMAAAAANASVVLRHERTGRNFWDVPDAAAAAHASRPMTPRVSHIWPQLGSSASNRCLLGVVRQHLVTGNLAVLSSDVLLVHRVNPFMEKWGKNSAIHPPTQARPGGGKGCPRAGAPGRDTARVDGRVVVAIGPLAAAHGSPVQNPYVRLGSSPERITARRSAWRGWWLPMPCPPPDRVLWARPGALAGHRLIGHPGAAAGCCRPGLGCWASDPRPGTAAAGSWRAARSARASSSLRSGSRSQKRRGCSEQIDL